MGRKLLDSKLLYIILSVAASFALWYYVTTIEGVTDTDTVSNIPVAFEGEDILLERGLMITSEPSAVTMRFEATSANLVKLKAEGAISASLDVSSITQPGTYTMAYQVSYSGISRNSFTVIDQNPINITFDVESYTTREVEIQGRFTGRLAEGYMLILENNQPKFEFSPITLTVSGMETDVNKIAYARVTVEDSELAASVSREFPYELIGWDGEPLDREALAVEVESETIHTTLRVQMYAEIPLTVEFVDGGGAALADDVTWEMNIESINVAGEAEVLEPLIAQGKINVATISLAEIETGETILTRPIPLADELINLDGVTEVTITINISGLVSKTLEVTEFEVRNAPEGYEGIVQTKSLFVTVRGTELELSEVSAANLRVVADLANITLAAGQYTVNARIYFDGIGNAGVFGTNYPLVVRLVEAEPEVEPEL